MPCLALPCIALSWYVLQVDLDERVLYGDCHVTSSAFDNIHQLPLLTYLDLASPKLDILAYLGPFNQMSSLQRLHLGCVGSLNAAVLGGMSQLQYLELGLGCKVAGNSLLAALPKLLQLRWLNLSHLELAGGPAGGPSTAAYSNLIPNSQLQGLSIIFCGVPESAWEQSVFPPGRQYPALQELDVDDEGWGKFLFPTVPAADPLEPALAVQHTESAQSAARLASAVAGPGSDPSRAGTTSSGIGTDASSVAPAAAAGANASSSASPTQTTSCRPSAVSSSGLQRVISGCAGLQHLALRSFVPADASFVPLQQLHGLTRLQVGGVVHDMVQQLACLTQLKDLHIWCRGESGQEPDGTPVRFRQLRLQGYMQLTALTGLTHLSIMAYEPWDKEFELCNKVS